MCQCRFINYNKGATLWGRITVVEAKLSMCGGREYEGNLYSCSILL